MENQKGKVEQGRKEVKTKPGFFGNYEPVNECSPKALKDTGRLGPGLAGRVFMVIL